MSSPPASSDTPSLRPDSPVEAVASAAGWPETDHAVLNHLRSGDPSEREDAVQQLFAAYSRPIRGYIRHHWPTLSHEEIDDLVTEFATSCLTGEKGHFLTYEPGREGQSVRLRSYLCTILGHFLVSRHRRSNSQRRGGARSFENLDTTQPAPHHETPPSGVCPTDPVHIEVYDRHWAQNILRLAFSKLSSGSTITEEVMAALKPWILADPGDATLKDLARQLGRTHAALRAQLYRLRKEWRKAVREAVGQTVANPDDVDDELRHLAAVLSRQEVE